jgi:uncharacterized protein YjiS (DUF1127 family)
MTSTSSLGRLVPLERTGRRFTIRLFEAFEVWRQRQALLTLDDRMLKDIGVSRADVCREAARHFWDLPS